MVQDFTSQTGMATSPSPQELINSLNGIMSNIIRRGSTSPTTDKDVQKIGESWKALFSSNMEMVNNGEYLEIVLEIPPEIQKFVRYNVAFERSVRHSGLQKSKRCIDTEILTNQIVQRNIFAQMDHFLKRNCHFCNLKLQDNEIGDKLSTLAHGLDNIVMYHKPLRNSLHKSEGYLIHGGVMDRCHKATWTTNSFKWLEHNETSSKSCCLYSFLHRDARNQTNYWLYTNQPFNRVLDLAKPMGRVKVLLVLSLREIMKSTQSVGKVVGGITPSS